jgi:pimeloyl-ACP methyl ester carboxylesterase
MTLLFLLALTAADTTETLRVPVAPAESLTVTMVGEGAPVVLIPGLFGSAFGFRHVMELLDEAGYRVVCIEPLGMGSSDRPEDADYSLTAQADRVAAVLDSLGMQQVVLVGHSLGASIAMRVSYRRPELAQAIVSVEGGPGETATTKGFRRWIRFAPAARMLNARRLMQQMLYRDMRSLSFDESWVDVDLVLAYTAGMARDTRGTVKAYQGMARAEEPELLGDHLHAIACPVVLLVGEAQHDAGPPPEQVALLTERLPLFSMTTIARSGFFIQEEQPAAIVRAVDRVSGDGDCRAGVTGPK